MYVCLYVMRSRLPLWGVDAYVYGFGKAFPASPKGGRNYMCVYVVSDWVSAAGGKGDASVYVDVKRVRGFTRGERSGRMCEFLCEKRWRLPPWRGGDVDVGWNACSQDRYACRTQHNLLR